MIPHACGDHRRSVGSGSAMGRDAFVREVQCIVVPVRLSGRFKVWLVESDGGLVNGGPAGLFRREWATPWLPRCGSEEG